MTYLDELNEPQREAVTATEGPSLIIAGAGSGKTRVLTYRIAHIMNMGVGAGDILALTFTNKASREMKSRIEAIVGHDKSRYLWMGTFHAIFSRLLRIEHEHTGFPSSYTIYDASDSRNLIRSILQSMELNEKAYSPNVVAKRISAAKNGLITPSAYRLNSNILEYDASIRMPRISEIYREYEKRCRIAGTMDFDDLLLKTNILFRDHKEVLNKYQERFRYILVDEYQDTNFAQYLIVKYLAEKSRNICVVGDDAQSIYSFRGARIENILNFQTDYPDYKIFRLEQNYRSTQNIVNAANSVILKNKHQIPKKSFSKNDTGNPVWLVPTNTENTEGDFVANEISETRMRNHYKYSDYAVLYRTNAQSRIFEESMRRRNIPYKIYGGLSFYQRKEIKDLLAYFRLIINRCDNEALKRIINFPPRGIGDTTLRKLEQAALERDTSIFEIITQSELNNTAELNKGTINKLINFAELINELAKSVDTADAYDLAAQITAKSGIKAGLNDDGTPEGLSRYENIQELLNGIREFSVRAKEEGLPGTLDCYMENVALLTDQDSEKDEDRNKITLMTVHSAKGLEFKNVFIAGVEENLFPATLQNKNNEPEYYEEERRLFYVALTRARENVYISFAKQRYRWGKLSFCKPSRFIAEIDSRYVRVYGDSEWMSGNDVASTSGEIKSGRTWSTGYQSAGQQQMLTWQLKKLRDSRKQNDDPDVDDPREIAAGMDVEHQRFGKGKVLKVEGKFPDLKAVVFFPNAGQRQLLLKYARLKIVK